MFKSLTNIMTKPSFTKSHFIFSQKRTIADFKQGIKYASELVALYTILMKILFSNLMITKILFFRTPQVVNYCVQSRKQQDEVTYET